MESNIKQNCSLWFVSHNIYNQSRFQWVYKFPVLADDLFAPEILLEDVPKNAKSLYSGETVLTLNRSQCKVVHDPGNDCFWVDFASI